MSSASAIPDSNPTRAQLRLVVLGQWVRAGLALARGAKAGRGLFGGAVALWQVFQAVRLAIALTQRLSELQGVLSLAASEARSGRTPAQGSVLCSDDPSAAAACLRQALIEIVETIRDALGLGPDRRLRPEVAKAARAAAEPEVPPALNRRKSLRGRRADRPPRPERRRALRPWPSASGALKTLQTSIVAPTVGRFRLAAG